MSRTNTSPDQIGEELFGIEPSVGSAGCGYELWPKLRTFPFWFYRSEATQAAWIGWQPWFYLRLKGLWLCWVVRGGIWCPVRLSAKAHSLTRLGYSPSNPEHSENDEPIERVPNVVRSACALKLLVLSVVPDRSVLLSSRPSN